MSQADKIFIKNCKDILNEGYSDRNGEVRPVWADGEPAYAISKFGIVNTYDLSKEFPLLTLRKINWSAALDEILWIWQKKSNNVHDLHSQIWDSWADSDGSIGKAYGYQLAQVAEYPEGRFDQVDRVLWQLKNEPTSRRIMTNLYIPADLHDMNLYPCAYSVTFNVEGHKLNAILNQRSQDMLTANNWNVVQYALLVEMLAQVNHLEPGKLIHVIANAHIYERHIDLVRELIHNTQYEAPQIILDHEIDNFYDFSLGDFALYNYQFSDFKHKIPVAI